jgi:indoleamine 2,3-dioxygenase
MRPIEYPTEFSALDQILNDMTIIQKNGSTGLLGHNKLRETVDKELPHLLEELKKVDEADDRLNAALFRDFSMLSSAYLLEGCHVNYLASRTKDNEGTYGEGMDHLPEKLAVPFKFTADRVRYGQPLLEYAYGYALNNWQLKDDKDTKNINYHNDDLYPVEGAPITSGIELIRKFHGSESEAGFVLIHVVIDSKTHHLTAAHKMMMEGARAKDRNVMN